MLLLGNGHSELIARGLRLALPWLLRGKQHPPPSPPPGASTEQRAPSGHTAPPAARGTRACCLMGTRACYMTRGTRPCYALGHAVRGKHDPVTGKEQLRHGQVPRSNCPEGRRLLMLFLYLSFAGGLLGIL